MAVTPTCGSPIEDHKILILGSTSGPPIYGNLHIADGANPAYELLYTILPNST